MSAWYRAQEQDLARTVSKMPPLDTIHHDTLRDGAKALYQALDTGQLTLPM
jgi:hypothetical protein